MGRIGFGVGGGGQSAPEFVRGSPVLRFSGSPVHLELNEAGSKNGEGRTLYFAAAVFLVGESNYEIHTMNTVPAVRTVLSTVGSYSTPTTCAVFDTDTYTRYTV